MLLSSQFPYYLNSTRRNVMMIVGVCLFLICFMLIFHPGHFSELSKIVLIASITFVVLLSSITFFPSLLPTLFDPSRFTLGRHFALVLLNLIAIGALASGTLNSLGFYPAMNYWETVIHVYPNVLAYGLMPIILVTLLVKNESLNEQLHAAIDTDVEIVKKRTPHKYIYKNDIISKTIQSDTSETLRLVIRDLLFVEASDNYSTFYWKTGNSIEKKLLRMNLKKAECQLDDSFIIRCHKSFMVNIYQVGTIVGNANGYKLGLCGGFSVPVSRSRCKVFMKTIKELRNVGG